METLSKKWVKEGTPVFIFVSSLLFFWYQIHLPPKLFFDENHYVAAARAMISPGQCLNLQHPPLSKFLIALGIAWLGDNGMGWRVMSVFFGALTLLAMYFWAKLLFRTERAGWLAVLLTLCNQLLFVQARIAMLDTQCFAFTALGLAAFTASWQIPRQRLWLYATGVLLGLSTACKWTGAFPLFWCLALVIFARVIGLWRLGLRAQGPDPWAGRSGLDLCLALAVVPFLVYLVTFIPLTTLARCHVSWRALLKMQYEMYVYQKHALPSHPYASPWWGWPLMIRPIWYYFESNPAGQVSGVVLLGNPFLMWGGLIALAATIRGWFRQRSIPAFCIATWYFGLYLPWAFLPHALTFYYYYYPSAMILSLAWVYLLEDPAFVPRVPKWAVELGVVLVAMALFWYFFPLLGDRATTMSLFRNRMWFRKWI